MTFEDMKKIVVDTLNCEEEKVSSEIFCLCGRSLRPISRASSSKRRALVPEVLWSIARIYFMLKTSPFPSRTGYVDPMREEQSLILTVLLRQQ